MATKKAKHLYEFRIVGGQKFFTIDMRDIFMISPATDNRAQIFMTHNGVGLETGPFIVESTYEETLAHWAKSCDA